MIDWLSIVAPCAHREPIHGGEVISVRPDGEIEWKSARRFSVRGSFESAFQLRTATHTPDRCTHIELSGNPAKWFQGHNLWGTDRLDLLVPALLASITARAELPFSPTSGDRQAWATGLVRLTRVDVTGSFHLRNRSEVLAWLRAAEQTAHLAHRGRGQLVKGSTLYFGQRSRRKTLKLYAKGQEIEAKGHGQDAILDLPSARAWADRTLRAELVLRSMELKRLGLDWVHAWHPLDGVPFAPGELLAEALGGMTMTTTSTLPDEVLSALTNAQRMGFLAWQAGHDLRQLMPPRSFYRLRSKLLPHGVDIATLLPSEPSNVVPLVRVLEAVPAGVPDWAIGTPLFYEPPVLSRVA